MVFSCSSLGGHPPGELTLLAADNLIAHASAERGGEHLVTADKVINAEDFCIASSLKVKLSSEKAVTIPSSQLVGEHGKCPQHSISIL